MKKLFFFLLFICCYLRVFSQNMSVEYSFGYGTYQLDDVKNIQNSLQQKMSQYGAKTTENFPAWYTHSGTYGFIIKRHHFGINFSYLTTGSRTGVTDYSGSYYADMILNGYRLGVFYRYYINLGISALDLYLQASQGIIISNVKTTESVNIATESHSKTEKKKSTAEYIEPTIGVKYRITNWLNISISGGYEVDSWLKLDESDIKVHWNGLRIYAGIGVTI